MMQVVEKVKKALEPIARERKYDVVDITYAREGGKSVLRIVIDTEGSLAMDECARLNNELSDLFDRENVVDEPYLLEVSSPGLDRKLKKDKDFIWAVGKKIKVTTYTPLDGKNVFVGLLLGLGDGTVVLENNGISTEIPREKVASARVTPDIDWNKK